jgi:D-sedoheptulose 7-phosphate isomerase
MSLRFGDDGKLLAFGSGSSATDAQHIAVEFVHPVLVGKRALPALALTNDVATVTGLAARLGFAEVFSQQVRELAGPADIALGVSADGSCQSVLRGLEMAHKVGALTIALTGGDGGEIAASPAVDHAVVCASDDRQVVKEVHVTTYHLLWELVHVFFERAATLWTATGEREDAPAEGLSALYPFLYGEDKTDEGVLDSVARSTIAKVQEIAALRQAVIECYESQLVRCAAAMARSISAGRRLFAFGNGGSSTDAQDVTQTFLDPPHGRPVPATSLTNDVAVVTALANDIGYDVVFARQIAALGRPGDVALGLSTSGGSENVLTAFAEAKRRGLVTVGLAGGDGGRMADNDAIDHLFVVSSSSVHRIQEAQTTLYHVLWSLTQQALRGELAT